MLVLAARSVPVRSRCTAPAAPLASASAAPPPPPPLPSGASLPSSSAPAAGPGATLRAERSAPILISRRGAAAAVLLAFAVQPLAPAPSLAADYTAVIAGPDYFQDTRELITLIGQLLDAESNDLARFYELSDAWEETHKLKHLGQDRSYIATFKAVYAVKGTAGAWSEAKGYYTEMPDGSRVPFDPFHVNFKRKVIRKYVDDTIDYLDEGLPENLLRNTTLDDRPL